MVDTITELKQRLREQGEKIASVQQLREHLATTRRRIAEMEPLANEVDELRVEAIQAKTAAREVQRTLDESVADHEEVVRGLQGQLRLLRGSAAEAAVRGLSFCTALLTRLAVCVFVVRWQCRTGVQLERCSKSSLRVWLNLRRFCGACGGS
jgi:hypothetical protein